MTLPKQLTLSLFCCVLFSCFNNDKSKKLVEKRVLNTTKLKAEADSFSTSVVTTSAIEKVNHLTTPFLKTADLTDIDRSFQTFLFDQKKDTVFSCEQGTVIKISKETFFIEGNDKPLGDIVIKVKEYYSISDIIAANLSTSSDNNILETGGMVFIEAFANDKECRIRDGSTVEIAFPFRKKKDGMIA
ncbi:MAG TPA: hypothetical protein VD794_04815, partial [Flavisolibacter sp.]|nr:hypothetical protein [Flavisolibacter sp.]